MRNNVINQFHLCLYFVIFTAQTFVTNLTTVRRSGQRCTTVAICCTSIPAEHDDRKKDSRR